MGQPIDTSANAPVMSSLPFLMTAMPVDRILALGSRRVDIGRGDDVESALALAGRPRGATSSEAECGVVAAKSLR